MMPRDHQVSLVCMNDGVYLVDVGFGCKYLRTIARYKLIHHSSKWSNSANQTYPWKCCEMGSYRGTIKTSLRRSAEPSISRILGYGTSKLSDRRMVSEISIRYDRIYSTGFWRDELCDFIEANLHFHIHGHRLKDDLR